MAANRYTSIEKFLQNLEVTPTKIVLVQQNGQKKTIVGHGNIHYRNLKRALDNNIIVNIMKDGYLTYQHCYDLALKYLDQHPEIKDIFQMRFKYVFVDETQDTDEAQFNILNSLFNEGTIIQRIGDNNQAIFNFSKKEQTWVLKEDYLEISNTKRLSSLIGNQASNFALNKQELNGTEVAIQPTIILFENQEDVLSGFVDLIREHNLESIEGSTFKAIGAVGKQNNNGHTLIDYFPTYTQYGNQECDTLVEKLENIQISDITFKDYKKIILDIVVDYLHEEKILCDNQRCTTTKIMNYLKTTDENEYERFKLKLYHIVKALSENTCIKEELKGLLQIFLNIKNQEINNTKFEEIIQKFVINLENKSRKNIYINDHNIEIEVSTIHKVKGETHTATLVLETFKNGYDLYQLLNLLKGRRKAGLEDKKKLMYVAMSRPTNFLCLAIHKQQKNNNTITEIDIEALEQNGFRVISI